MDARVISCRLRAPTWYCKAPATQAHFKCVGCGYENHADVVGAINVLARGHRVVACGGEGSGLGRKTRTKPASVKQEPTEVTMGELAHA
jgi:putative transposase